MKIPSFSDSILQAISNTLGATDNGLTGSEIGLLLQQLEIQDPESSSTKKHRLFYALKKEQDLDGCGNSIVKFIQAAMSPVSYIERASLFQDRRNRINEILSFSALYLEENGNIRPGTPAKTIEEAQQIANRLKSELQRRNAHPDVLKFCRVELLQENFFHAVLEACKSLAENIRQKANLRSDGAPLVDEAFGLGSTKVPMLAFNSLSNCE